MDPYSGQIYPDPAAATDAGVRPDDVVEVTGRAEMVERVSRAVQQMAATERRHAKNREARKQRRKNRR